MEIPNTVRNSRVPTKSEARMELINREVYRRQLEKSLELMERAGDSQDDIACGMRRAIRLLDMQDVVDAEPVKHGEWMFQWDPINDPKRYFVRIVCSVCGLKTGQKSNYCPLCGAKMDGKEGEGK